ACLDVSAAQNPNRERLALQLKRVLDARGMYVPTGTMSTDPDYTDAAGEHRLVVVEAMPQVYLTKQGDRWLYSRSTVQQIPELYEQTFSSAMIKFQKILPPVFFQRIFGLFLWQYAYFLLLLAAALGVGQAAQLILTRQVVRAAQRLGLAVDLSLLRRIRGPLTWFAAGLVFRLGIPDLQFGVASSFFLNFIATSILSLSAVIIATRAVDVVGDLFAKRAELTDSKLDDQVIPLVSRATKSALWALGIVFILQNIGVEVTALLAGVSVGGVAVALAAQDTIGNLFGSLTIFTDRPFQIGDWVIIGGDIEGVVEEVGFRSTRIRTFGNSVVSVPNAKVANSAVDNMGKRAYRRMKLTLGLRYDTPTAKVRAFLAEVEALLTGHPSIWQDTIEVRFINFGDSALELMVYTFLDVPDWTGELAEKQEILLRIMEIAENLGVGFAFPSVSVYPEGRL
ncbi:MAG: MscS family membrane protein, partial [Myxococcota bacterium]